MWKKRAILKITNRRYEFASFILPVLIMVLAFAFAGIFPFGENQIAVIDMYHQYVPFLSELQSKLQSGESLLFSWNIGCGINFWCLISYYCASPLNFILFLFPKDYLMEGITVVLLIKIGLSGSFMYMYLKETQRLKPLVSFVRKDLGGAFSSEAHVDDYPGKAGGLKGLAFSCMYALCSFVLGYYWCIMWMDAVMLLPLCILGLNRIIEGRSPVLYTVSIALTVFSNYYMAIMVCIFIMCYYPVLYFIKDRSGVKECAVTTAKAVGFSFMGIAMAAVMLLPTYLSMGKTYYFKSQMQEEWSFYNSFIDILRQFLPGYELTFREGLPNLYCGAAAVVMVVFYYISRRISLREKFLNSLMLVFLLFSLNVNKLDFIWHGMHFPNQLPYRYSFVVSFLILGMAYKGFSSIERGKGIKSSNIIIALLMAITIADCGFGACRAVETVGTTTRTDYFREHREISLLGNEREEAFVRTEIYGRNTLNNPALFGYKGISQFSSSADADASDLLEAIGLEAAGYKNRHNYVLTDPVTNALLNVGYLISCDSEINDDYFESMYRRGDCFLYKSRYPLSVGYMTDERITGWKLDPTDPYEGLNDFLRRATGDSNLEVFSEAKDVTVEERKKSTEIKAVSDRLKQYYIFVEPSGAKSAEILINGEYSRSIREDCGAIVYGGRIDKGDSISVRVNYEDGTNRISEPLWKICTVNDEQWDRAYAKLSDELMEVDKCTDRGLCGSVKVKKDGRLVISVPYEDGWTVKVDGRKFEIKETVGDCWISIPLKKGEHYIEMSFIPAGLAAGVIISAAAVIMLIAVCRFSRGRLRRKSAGQCLPEESDCNKKS